MGIHYVDGAWMGSEPLERVRREATHKKTMKVKAQRW